MPEYLTQPEIKGARMNMRDETLTNGRYELPPSARGVLVLADPPEAGWRMQTTSSEVAAADTNLLPAPGRKFDRQQACDTCAPRDAEPG
jgi:hypothetical protein